MMDERQKFVIQAAKEREERIARQGATNVVVQLQALSRGFIARKKLVQRFENEFDIKFGLIYSENALVPTNVQLLNFGTLLCRFLNESENIVRYGAFCRQLAQSMFSADDNVTFATLLVDKVWSNSAVNLIRRLHTKVPSILAIVDLDKVTHHKSATAIVTYLVLTSSPTLWTLTKQKNELGPKLQSCCATYSLERIGPNDDSINGIVKDQLQNFWSKKMVFCLFGKVLGSVEGTNTKKLVSQGDSLSTDLINRLKKLMVKEQPDYSMNLGPVSLTAVVCQLYQNAILTFQKLHDDIVRGFLFSADPTGSLPHFSPFSLFAHTAHTQISSLDEQEMYEEGVPFSTQQLCDIAHFTNVFCFKAIWENILGKICF
uniref:HECT-type E3 ubiquitin transferase n=1 Tax=Panagrolaimus sp. JU765 TaxID=591449 RepID=A0AC34QY40_9BILA